MPVLVPLGERRRVEDDEVEGAFAHLRHIFFHVGHMAGVLFFRIAVQLEVGLGHGDGFLGGVDGDGPAGTAFQRRDGEAACVAEGIEHGLALGKAPHQLAVLALVEEEARLLAFLPVGQESAVVFQNDFIQSFTKEVAVFYDGVFLAHALHGLGAFVVDGLHA